MTLNWPESVKKTFQAYLMKVVRANNNNRSLEELSI